MATLALQPPELVGSSWAPFEELSSGFSYESGSGDGPLPASGANRTNRTVLALMGLANNSLLNGAAWAVWLREARESGHEPRIFIHASDDTPFEPPEFRDFVIPARVNTTWCRWSLVRAELKLAKAVLKDPEVTHVATISESHFPVKPYSQMLADLERDPLGRFCGESTALGWDRVNRSNYAEMWWVQERASVEWAVHHQHDAVKLVDRTINSSVFFGLDAPGGYHRGCPDEHFWTAALSLHRRHVRAQRSALLAGGAPSASLAALPTAHIGQCPTMSLWGDRGCLAPCVYDGTCLKTWWTRDAQTVRCNCSALLHSNHSTRPNEERDEFASSISCMPFSPQAPTSRHV